MQTRHFAATAIALAALARRVGANSLRHEVGIGTEAEGPSLGSRHVRHAAHSATSSSVRAGDELTANTGSDDQRRASD